jgi:hypothetical protein
MNDLNGRVGLKGSRGDPTVPREGVGCRLRAVWVGVVKEARVGLDRRSGDIGTPPAAHGLKIGWSGQKNHLLDTVYE